MIRGMRPITVMEVAETVKKLIGDVKIEYKEGRLGDFEGKIVPAEKAKRELGWEPKVDFEEGVRRYIEWFRKIFYKKRNSLDKKNEVRLL